jgi:hypothetical protein
MKSLQRRLVDGDDELDDDLGNDDVETFLAHTLAACVQTGSITRCARLDTGTLFFLCTAGLDLRVQDSLGH